MVQLMEVYRESSPLLATAEFSPAVLTGHAATMCMAFLHSRVTGQTILALAMAAFCLGNVLVAVCPVSSTYWSYIIHVAAHHAVRHGHELPARSSCRTCCLWRGRAWAPARSTPS